MSHPLTSLIDQIIAKAQAEGQMDNLIGEGKPLERLHASNDAVLGHILKENKVKLPVVALREEIAVAEADLKTISDPKLRREKMQILADLQLRLAIEVEAFGKYG